MAEPIPPRTEAPILDTQPLVRAAIAEDALLNPYNGSSIPEGPVHEDNGDSEEDQEPIIELEHCLTNPYSRPGYLARGLSRATVVASVQAPERGRPTRQDLDTAREEERSLLRDNQIIPPKHPRGPSAPPHANSDSGILNTLRKVSSSRQSQSSQPLVDGSDQQPSESSALLGTNLDLPYGGQDNPATIDRKWEEAVTAGKIQTTWRRESKVLLKYSWPLTLTFILQYSLTVTSVFTVGHLGKSELGAVSLATMTAGITGYAVYQGMCTSLDTLCAQAYGSGHKKLVGLQLQRMVLFLFVCSFPIAFVWFLATAILLAIVGDEEQQTAEFAGLYMKIIILGMPGYLCFESGKRFVQAQGLFRANLYVLLVVAPLNAFLHYLFVWHFGWGFVGAPIAVVITETILPLGLFLYVYFVAGKDCWGGLSRAAFYNWGPMIRLAIPGLAMVMAEYMAFEILTLAAARLGGTELAAQSVLSNIGILAWQVPFSVSIASSTRIANLIGATLADAAKTSARVTYIVEFVVGVFNMVLLSSLRYNVPQLFTNNENVVATVAATLPVVAAFQLFDSLTACCNGILRGIGRQEIGGVVGLFAYYIIGLPISFATCFGLDWGLSGLWAGPAIGLGLWVISFTQLKACILFKVASTDYSTQGDGHRNLVYRSRGLGALCQGRRTTKRLCVGYHFSFVGF